MSRNTPRFLLVALAMSALSSAGQGQVCALGIGSPSYRPNLDRDPNAIAAAITKRIGEAFTSVCTPKCPIVSIFDNPTAPNALAFAAPPLMKIVYSPTFFTTVSKRYGGDAFLGIVAHEYGHVIDAVSLGSWMSADWPPELRADAWAGSALAKLKLKPQSLEQALTAIARYPPASQPNWATRVVALRSGYGRYGSASDFDQGAAAVTSRAKKR